MSVKLVENIRFHFMKHTVIFLIHDCIVPLSHYTVTFHIHDYKISLSRYTVIFLIYECTVFMLCSNTR